MHHLIHSFNFYKPWMYCCLASREPWRSQSAAPPSSSIQQPNVICLPCFTCGLSPPAFPEKQLHPSSLSSCPKAPTAAQPLSSVRHRLLSTCRFVIWTLLKSTKFGPKSSSKYFFLQFHCFTVQIRKKFAHISSLKVPCDWMPNSIKTSLKISFSQKTQSKPSQIKL